MNRPGHRPLALLLVALAPLAAQAAGEVPIAMGPAHAEMRMMDSNGDGKLTREEHAAGARRMFEAMDANRDGALTAEEHAASAQRMFDAMDTDRNAVLSLPELAAGRQRMRQRP